MSKLVSVIIVNYNGAAYIDECLRSIYDQTYKHVEIIVVDNNSIDNSVNILKLHAGIKLIESHVNLGFAKGNNIAIEQAQGEYIALLNNDAVADPYWVETLVQELESDPSLGSSGSKILSYYNREIIDSVGLRISREGLARGEGRLAHESRYAVKKHILIPSGCAVMFRRTALEETGLFDEEFFCYCEDVDLGLRLQLNGWKCLFVPESVVYHRYSETAGKYSKFKAYHVERNHFYFLIKNYPAKYLILNPIYTIYRYLYQVKSMLTSQGATAEFTKSVKPNEIIMTMLKAHLDVWRQLPRMLNKRSRIQRARKVSSKAFDKWIEEYGIELRELFKD